MDKKIAIILMSIFLASILLSGCLEESKSDQQETYTPYNSAPVPIITAPEIAYFGESIEFDASASYDSDGKIVSYEWHFGDEETAEGVKVTHTYEFDNDFNIEYPLIFSVVLGVLDDNGSWEPIINQIMLYPREYIFYLASGELKVEKPSSSKDTIKASFGKLKFNALQELEYDLSESIKIYPCNFNVSIYLEKPRLTLVNQVSLTLYDEAGEKIAEESSNFKLFEFWKEKTIKISGKIVTSKEFKSIELVIYGFSLREKIDVLYGGEKASQICFDFTI